MKTLLAAAILAMLLISVLAAQRSEDGPQPASWTLAVDKDNGKEEQSISLQNPKTLTVCSDAMNPVFLSMDGKHWHRLQIDSDRCVQAPPARFVKLQVDWNATSNAEVYATY
jgi:hypothetical protein